MLWRNWDGNLNNPKIYIVVKLLYNMKDKTFMRVNKELLEEIKKCKIAPRESYADVVKRVIDKERKLKR